MEVTFKWALLCVLVYGVSAFEEASVLCNVTYNPLEIPAKDFYQGDIRSINCTLDCVVTSSGYSNLLEFKARSSDESIVRLISNDSMLIELMRVSGFNSKEQDRQSLHGRFYVNGVRNIQVTVEKCLQRCRAILKLIYS